MAPPGNQAPNRENKPQPGASGETDLLDSPQALALANELDVRSLQAHCHRGLDTVNSQTDQSEQARAKLSLAIDMYRDMEMTCWLPETEAALAEVESR